LATDRYERFKESVYTVGAALMPIENLELGIRYEYLDDDDIEKKSLSWSVEDRYSIGGTYTFFENEYVSCYSMLEYRKINYRVHQSIKATQADSNDEYYARIGVSF
jgi:hypothetical protein